MAPPSRLPYPYGPKISLMQEICESAATKLYHIHSTKASNKSRAPKDPITVICISDTHNTQPSLPAGDMLIHSGDLTNRGSFDELQTQIDWINSQPHKHKIVIAGNHDLLLDSSFVDQHPERVKEVAGKTREDLSWGNIVYLEDSSSTLDFENGRQLNVYGSPWTPQFGNWAFQYPPIRDVWTRKIPVETDVLVTHGPPYLHLDMNGKGCGHLLKELRRVRPVAVVFGHIHAGYGEEFLSYDGVQEAWEQVLLGTNGFLPLLKMIFRIAWPYNGVSTRLVNAAVLREESEGGLRSPVVIRL